MAIAQPAAIMTAGVRQDMGRAVEEMVVMSNSKNWRDAAARSHRGGTLK
jgi:hypothetical protein